MLILIIIFSLFALVLKLIDWPVLRKIKTATDSETAIKYRESLLRNRKIAFISFVAFLVLITLNDIDEAIYAMETDIYLSTIIILSDILSIVILYLYLRSSNKYMQIKGRVSTFTASEFCNTNERFVLFLRSFERDTYKENECGKWDFSEEILAKIVEKGMGIHMCAVGMTKEGDSPFGGIRVYVNDETWEDEVYKLMCKAEKVIILVSDKKSCLWEIKMTKDIYHKCLFIVDNLEKYENARTQLSGILDLPSIPPAEVPDIPLEYDPRGFYFTADNVMKDFCGEFSNYCQMLDLPADAVCEKDISEDKKEPFYTRPFFIFLMIIAVINFINMLIQ